ncbi:TIGR00269 family protein [Candidatus Pacearchaeota archaeon]|nr:TIGR00269 family protein [Candidatus Pacearchaeota archaeon]
MNLYKQKKLEAKVKQTLKKISLSKKAKVLVAMSGGKDSTTLTYLLKKFGYNISGLYVNLCVGEYSELCLEKVKELCDNLDIKLHVYDLKKEQGVSVKNYWKKNPQLNHCAACGVLKKWILNKIARKLKYDFIATGHNLDDEAQTFLVNIFKGSPELSANTGIISKTIKEKNKFIPRIKPLYYIPEKDILVYAKQKKLRFLSGKCPYAQESYRISIRNFLENKSSKIKQNIIKNFERVSGNIQNFKKSKIQSCEICGEPSRGKICKKCSLSKF